MQQSQNNATGPTGVSATDRLSRANRLRGKLAKVQAKFLKEHAKDEVSSRQLVRIPLGSVWVARLRERSP